MIRIRIFCFSHSTHPVSALSLTKDMEKLMKEVSTMSEFKHPNVMPLIGVCFDKEAPLVIMPFMMNGSVLDYVKHNRESLYCNSPTMVAMIHFHNYAVAVALFLIGGVSREGVFGYVSPDQ